MAIKVILDFGSFTLQFIILLHVARLLSACGTTITRFLLPQHIYCIISIHVIVALVQCAMIVLGMIRLSTESSENLKNTQESNRILSTTTEEDEEGD